MIPLSAAAEAAFEALTQHYTALGRDRAIDRLVESLQRACARFEARRGLFFDAPRPYPKLADLGFRWAKEGRYWIAFQVTDGGPVVAGVFYESADIPNRL